MSFVYTYACEACGHRHDIPGRVDAEPAEFVSCPRCVKRARRIWAAPTIVYMGGGWTGAQKARRGGVERR